MAKGKMTRCAECGKPFAAAAKSCPYCGEKNPLKKSPVLKIVLGVLCAFVLIGVIGAMLGGDDDSDKPKSLFNISPRPPWRHVFRPDCVKNPCNPSGLLRLFALQDKKPISPIRTR